MASFDRNPSWEGARPSARNFTSSETDLRYVRQPSPAESYLSRRHPESMYEQALTKNPSRPAARKQKALALLQEFRETEDERLAELHLKQPQVSRYTRHHELPDNERYRRSLPEQPISKDSLFPELDAFGARGRKRSLYGNIGPSRTPCEHHRSHSENLIELDATPQERPIPELPGSELETTYWSAKEKSFSADYGDKRYNTLPGEALPMQRKPITFTFADNESHGSVSQSSDVQIVIGEHNAIKFQDIRPDIDLLSGFPLASGLNQRFASHKKP